MVKLKSLIMEDNRLIVYHGTGKRFRKFNLKCSTQGLVWFTSNKDVIKAGETGAQGKGFIVTAEVTINKPAGWKEYDKYLIWELKGFGYDGAVLPNNNGFDCFVWNPDQIKILNVEKT